VGVHRCLLNLFCLSMACAQVRSQGDFFGDPLPAEPFDREPFRPVRVPDWVRGTLGAGYTLSVMDSPAREKAAKAGVTLSEMGFVDPFYTYYDSKLLKKRSPHVPAGRIAKDIAEYGRLGVNILGVYPPCLQSEVYEAHPDWRRVTTADGKIPQVDLKMEPHGGMLCLLGPYGDFFIEVLAEIATVHPQVAAFSFDGLHHGGFCFCEHCRKNYLAETGKKIPAPDMENKEFRLYQHWADRRLEGLVRKMQTRLKGIRKDLALVTWSTNAGRWGHFLSVPRNMPARLNLLFDAPDQEFWMDESNRGNTIVPAFGNAQIWSTTNHRVAFSEPYLMSHGNPYSKDGLPAHELERRMKLVVTHGAFPSLAVAQPKRLQQAAYTVLQEIQHLKPWLVDQKPLPWAGLVVSDNTRNFYSRSAGAVEDRYLAHPLGFFRALLEEHVPFNLLQDWNLTAADLAPYKVLVLPNTACLAPNQMEAIRGFVEAGGGLVASMEVGGFDQTGNPWPVDPMSGWLGFQHQGPMSQDKARETLDWNFERGVTQDYWLKRKGVHSLALSLKTELADKALAKVVDEEPVVFKGPALAVAPKEGAEIHAWYVTPNGKRSPAILSRKIGKGRIVYLAAGIDAAYYSYAYPWQRVLLANAVRWAAGGPPPVVVTAPKCVHSTYRLLPGSQRLVVHLYNDLNTTGGKARPEEDVPLREEVIPIYDIAIYLAEDLRVERVRLQPSGKELPVVREGGRLKVVVPRLEIHQVVELEAGKKLFQEVEKPN
jgi:hypothetical protein